MKVLNKIPINAYPRVTSTSIIIAIILFIVLLLLLYTACKKYYDSSMLMIGIYLTIAIYWGCAVIYFFHAEPSGKYLYEATIYDKTSFHEIVDKYEILDKRGDIYTLKER